MASYYSTINFAAELAPSLEATNGPTKFIGWAEDICQIISFVFPDRDYDQVSGDLIERVREVQDYEDES